MSERDATRVLAGIDEAGLGPLLGPLTLGYCVMRLPRAGGNLWERLGTAVSQDPRDQAERLIVADSKKVFSRNRRGRERLESTALAFLGLQPGREVPRRGADLLALCPTEWSPDARELARHPWYAELSARLPMWMDAGRLELRRERLRRALLEAQVELLEAGVRVVPVGELNRSYRSTDNKAHTVWERVRGLLRHLWRTHGTAGPHVFVDRQGGRFHYAAPLLRAFPEAELEVRGEHASRSSYRLRERRAGRRMEITFAERAESRAFGVAVASCLAKYVREACMGAFNRYFAGLQPELRPTAGYTTDGRRWMREAGPALERAGLERDVLVRAR